MIAKRQLGEVEILALACLISSAGEICEPHNTESAIATRAGVRHRAPGSTLTGLALRRPLVCSAFSEETRAATLMRLRRP